MPTSNWQKPPILNLLLRLRLFIEQEHKKELEQKLISAKKLLDSQIHKLKVKSND